MVIYQDQPPINHRLILCFSLYMAYYFHLFSNAAPTQAWIHFVVPPPPTKKNTHLITSVACRRYIQNIWTFPKIVVPPNHQFQ